MLNGLYIVYKHKHDMIRWQPSCEDPCIDRTLEMMSDAQTNAGKHSQQYTKDSVFFSAPKNVAKV